MSDIPHIQVCRETLVHHETLRKSESFQWFIRECVDAEMAQELATILDLNKTMMDADRSRHIYTALKGVKDRLESKRRTAQQYIDSQRKT